VESEILENCIVGFGVDRLYAKKKGCPVGGVGTLMRRSKKIDSIGRKLDRLVMEFIVLVAQMSMNHGLFKVLGRFLAVTPM
jgi:hypothetical protein